jgi:hypothetical protein
MAGESDVRVTAGGGRWLFELAATGAIFAAVGAWPVPDVNEAVYLTKARHHADPAWGRGDFFLETPDAHATFYVLFGPIAAALPLDQAAWVGRILGWLALAIGFRHVASAVVATSWGRIAAAAIFAMALQHTTAAGEWVIGGCEAKVFAWAAVFAGLGALARGRFPPAFLCMGLATALHPIVGGWAGLAAVIIWAIGPRSTADWRSPAGVACLVAAAVGVAIGVVPLLGLGDNVEPAARAAAARIYVVERLHHHLLPRSFAEPMVARHVLAVLVWWLLSRLLSPSPARARITAFTLVALAISLVGLCLSLCEPFQPGLIIGLLRFYWFRLADVMVPVALAVSGAAVLEESAACTRLAATRPGMFRATAATLLGLWLAAQAWHWPVPGRSAVAARADAKLNAAAWADICDWVRDNTPADACFVTPRGAASFTWRTGRPEVVAWKNSPQDAAALVAWRQRILDCFSAHGSLVDMERSTAALGAQRLRLVADRYEATYAIVPLDVKGIADLPFERLHANRGYAVYRLTPKPADREPHP